MTVRRMILLVFIATFLIPLMPTSTSYADPVKTGAALIGSYTPKQVAESASFYSVLGQCVKGNMKGDIKLNAADDGNATPASWFDNNSAYGTVWPKGKQDCKDFAGEALKLWGYESNQDFLSALGYKYDSKTLKWSGTSNSNTRMNNFRAAVGLRVYGSMVPDPVLTDPGKYELYNSGFASDVCKATDLGIYPTSNKTANTLAEQGKSIPARDSKAIPGVEQGTITYKVLPIITSDGAKTEKHVYAYVSSLTYGGPANAGPQGAGTTLYGYRSSGAGSNTKSCTEMANAIPDLSKSWIAWSKANPGKATPPAAPGQEQSEPGSEAAPSCAIDAVGWIVCPVVNFMAGIVDTSYSIVAALLTTPPLNTNTGDARNGAYIAWKIMRNFANVMFVIAFIIIIYSQLTGAGINNYGIKKLLPKLVIAAILVNVSYWVCAIAVDLSNILGSSIKGLMDGVSAQMPLQNVANETDWRTGGAVWGPLAALALAAGTAALLQFTILLPLLIAALAAIVTVFIVLVLRQALIIALIVVSPLAFVALLLPNTEGLFKKWRVLLVTMLLMFPIIAFIFGASSLASTIVQSTTYSGEAGQAYKANILLQIVGAGIAVIPLFITPLVMKTAGGVLNRFAGVVNDPNKGIFDRMRKGASNYRGYRKDVNRGNRLERGSNTLEGEGNGMGGQYSRRRRAWAAVRSGGATVGVNASQKAGFAKAVASESAQEYFAQRALNQDGFAKSIAGEDKAEGLKASAQGAVDKILQQDAANREILYRADVKFKNNPEEALKQALEAGDTVGIRAASSMLMKGGSSGYGKFNDTIAAYDSSHDISDSIVKQSISDVKSFIGDNGKDFKVKDPAALIWSKNTSELNPDGANPYQTMAQANAKPGAVSGSDQEVAMVAPDSLRRAAAAGTISSDKARSILSNADLASATSDDNKETLRAIIANNGQPINLSSVAPSGSQTTVEATKIAMSAAISSLASQAPTVQQIQQSTTIVNQTSPQTLTIPHADTPATGRRSSDARVDDPGSSSRSQSSPSRSAPSISDFERLEQAELNRRRQR